MKAEKKQFIQFLVDSGCLKFGDFQLKSGDRSPFFVNLGQADSGATGTAPGVASAAGPATSAAVTDGSLILSAVPRTRT